MEYKDYYEIMGVPRKASQDDLKKDLPSVGAQIPPGCQSGRRCRGPGFGSGRAGDLYLEVEFQADEHFQVEGRDVYLKLPVTPWEATLGAKVNVPAPSGSIDLTIPPNSGRGRKLRVKGKGLPGKEPGDLLVELDIVFPPADSDAAKKIYREMREELFFDPRSGMRRS